MQSLLVGILLVSVLGNVRAATDVTDVSRCQDPNFKSALISRTICFSGLSPSDCQFSKSIVPYLEASLAGGAAVLGAGARLQTLVQRDLQNMGQKLAQLNRKNVEFRKVVVEFESAVSVRDEKKLSQKISQVSEESRKLVSEIEGDLKRLKDPRLAGLLSAELKIAEIETKIALQKARSKKSISVEMKAHLEKEIAQLRTNLDKAYSKKWEIYDYAEKKIRRNHLSSSLKGGGVAGAGTFLALDTVFDFGLSWVERASFEGCGLSIEPEILQVVKDYATLDTKTCKLFMRPEAIIEILHGEEGAQILKRAPILCAAMQDQLMELKKRQEGLKIQVQMMECKPPSKYVAKVSMNGSDFIHSYRVDGQGSLILESSIFSLSDKEKGQKTPRDDGRTQFSLYMNSINRDSGVLSEGWTSVRSEHLNFGHMMKLGPNPEKLVSFYQRNSQCEFPQRRDGLNSQPLSLACGIGQQIVAANHTFNDILACDSDKSGQEVPVPGKPRGVSNTEVEDEK